LVGLYVIVGTAAAELRGAKPSNAVALVEHFAATLQDA
jgi:hypothetical protein